MKIGVLLELNDARVSIIPATVKKWIGQEHTILIEKSAGESAFFPDQAYLDAGASVVSRQDVLMNAEILLAINPPTESELESLNPDTIVIAQFQTKVNTALAEKVKTLSIIPFSLDLIPRTTIAQVMDVLSSMSSLAGYKAVITAANHLPGYFPMMMTAAGTIPPARVLVLGAGVAGLQAIATARRLGAIVEAFDVRSVAKEEVESLGAKFVEVPGAKDDESAGGYAITQSIGFQQKQREAIQNSAKKANVVITTANVPGRKAPLLIENETVSAMQMGSVIIDLAAASGGNCALTQNDKTIIRDGVIIIGNSNLANEMSHDASKLWSNNVKSFVDYVCGKGKTEIDFENEIVAATFIGTR
ncbi:UNVERIFIED_CONTAM: hypothetical protein GTU68_012037 [Idotea baltica]|nr:hypothetical protein [Idotea baltica]